MVKIAILQMVEASDEMTKKDNSSSLMVNSNRLWVFTEVYTTLWNDYPFFFRKYRDRAATRERERERERGEWYKKKDLVSNEEKTHPVLQPSHIIGVELYILHKLNCSAEKIELVVGKLVVGSLSYSTALVPNAGEVIMCIWCVYLSDITAVGWGKWSSVGARTYGEGARPPPPPPPPPSIILEGAGGNIPFGPPIIHPFFSLQCLCETVKTRSQKYQFIYMYARFILFEGISKSILFNSILNFAISSVFSVRNVII